LLKKVLSLIIRRNWFETRPRTLAFTLLAILAAISLTPSRLSTQNMPVIVGRIEGDDLAVKTTTNAGVEIDAGPTVVASGSDVTVRSGHALLLLDAGGEISICGPAHFKLIRSSGAVTLALDYGRVHPSLESSDGFTIYTPTIVATPIAIAGGPRNMTLGLQQDGEMCVLTASGAMRVETQFSDQSMIIPQGGTATLAGGQIESLQPDASACSCDFPRAHMESPKSAPPSRSQPVLDVGALAPPLPPQHTKTDNVPPPSASAGEPVYTVLMPPLSFDANSPEPPPDPAPETILLVREVRLRPTVEFRGHVNPAPSQTVAVHVSPPAPTPAVDRPAESQPGVFDRVRNFFRRLTGKGPCAGAGCNS
jgi:hypothetical protein